MPAWSHQVKSTAMPEVTQQCGNNDSITNGCHIGQQGAGTGTDQTAAPDRLWSALNLDCCTCRSHFVAVTMQLTYAGSLVRTWRCGLASATGSCDSVKLCCSADSLRHPYAAGRADYELPLQGQREVVQDNYHCWKDLADSSWLLHSSYSSLTRGFDPSHRAPIAHDATELAELVHAVAADVVTVD